MIGHYLICLTIIFWESSLNLLTLVLGLRKLSTIRIVESMAFGFKTVGIALAAFVFAGCAPRWEPPADYRGGFLVGVRPLPREVTVQPGDNVYLVARRYNVPMKTIIQTNSLRPPYILQPGQVLRLSQPQSYLVAGGDTLYAISRRYGVDMRAIAQANGLVTPYTIFPGQRLAIPDAYTNAVPSEPGTSEKPPSRGGQLKPSNAITDVRTGPSSARSNGRPKPAVIPLPPPARSGSQFVWPVEGDIVAKFGPAGKGLHNDGINIAVKRGVPVRAAENGVVAYSGNELQGFGNLLLIKHADGWMSAYAHNEQLLVERGERVQRGQEISRAGQTGSVRSPQLHFELRRGTRAVDPLDYMVGRQSS